MPVSVRLNLPLQQITGQEVISVSGDSVMMCLVDLMQRYPEARDQLFNRDGSLAPIILLNNELLPGQDLNHPVTEADELWLMSFVDGG